MGSNNEFFKNVEFDIIHNGFKPSIENLDTAADNNTCFNYDNCSDPNKNYKKNFVAESVDSYTNLTQAEQDFMMDYLLILIMIFSECRL